MNNIILLISGKQGVGKSTLSQNLFNRFTAHRTFWVYAMKFADPLYAMYEQIWRVLEEYGETKPVKIDGTLLQLLGTEWGRKTVRESLWCDLLKNRVLGIMEKFEDTHHRLFIIDDARFPNEIDAFKEDVKVKILRVRLEAGEHVRRERAEKWRNNVSHPSEIALDNYNKWDLVIYTDKHNASETLELVEKQIRILATQ